MALAAVFPLNGYSAKEPPFDKEAKKIAKSRIRDDGDGSNDSDDSGGDDNDDNNYDNSTTRTTKTHECVSSSSFPTYTVTSLWVTASSASSSTAAKETLTTTEETITTNFPCISRASSTASLTLFLLSTSAGSVSSSANPAPTIVGKRPIQITKASIMVPILGAIIFLLLGLVGYLVFRISRYRRERDAGRMFYERGGNRQSSVYELDTASATQKRRTWYSRIRESFISPKVLVRNCTSHVYQVPDYDSYINWAHRSSSVYSSATMSDISSGYGTYGPQHALPIQSHGVGVGPTKSSMVY